MNRPKSQQTCQVRAGDFVGSGYNDERTYSGSYRAIFGGSAYRPCPSSGMPSLASALVESCTAE